MTTQDHTNRDTGPDPQRPSPRALLFAGHGRGRKLVATVAAIGVLGSGSLFLSSGGTPAAAQTPSARAADLTPGCSGYRWQVKTLSDPAAQSVNLTPQDTTIAALHSFPANRGGPRIGGIETQAWKLSNVQLSGFRYQADGDVHLIATAAAGRTIITELPNSKCTQGGSRADRGGAHQLPQCLRQGSRPRAFTRSRGQRRSAEWASSTSPTPRPSPGRPPTE